MELGLIGLGKMGFNMATRLRQGGHTVVASTSTRMWCGDYRSAAPAHSFARGEQLQRPYAGGDAQ